jgi:isopentenyl-diphosphate delta-isomerase
VDHETNFEGRWVLVLEERVILVGPDDEPVGTAEKLEAHRSGALHRAFSVFVLDGKGRILMQRRADGKYHSGGRWSNSCCGHPRPGEETEAAAERRLQEEMGFSCKLRDLFSFTYRVEMGNGLWEHEIDHVLIGRHDGELSPDPAEVAEWRWILPDELESEIARGPAQFTPWLSPALAGLLRHLPLDPRTRSAP